jgi:DNA-binding NarL/FixJ family response regulator
VVECAGLEIRYSGLRYRGFESLPLRQKLCFSRPKMTIGRRRWAQWLAVSVNILLVDDHALFREGFALLLERRGFSCVIHQARTIRDALSFLPESHAISLLLMDFYIDDAHGLQGLQALRHAFPDAAIVFVSASHDAALIHDAMEQGARGFIHKTSTGEAMMQGLRDVLDGGNCFLFPEDILPPVKTSPKRLTSRQREVLSQLCLGRSNKEIGRALSMSENTVRIHLADIFRVLHVASRAEAIVLAKGVLLYERDEVHRSTE